MGYSPKVHARTGGAWDIFGVHIMIKGQQHWPTNMRTPGNVIILFQLGVRSIAISVSVCLFVCLFVYVCSHVSGTTFINFTKFSALANGSRGSIIFWRWCNTLCTSVLWMTSYYDAMEPDAQTTLRATSAATGRICALRAYDAAWPVYN